VVILGGCRSSDSNSPAEQTSAIARIQGMDPERADLLFRKEDGFDSLAIVVFDMSTELTARTTGNAATHHLPGRPPAEVPMVALADPVVGKVAPPTEAELGRARAAAIRSSLARVTIVRTQNDVDRVAERFSSAGFRTTRTLEGRGELTTNNLLFGDSVSLDAVKYVSLEMMRAGLPLGRIRLSRDTADAFRIRLTNLNHVETMTPLSVAQILAMRRRPPAADPSR
jgi:hypothetical protein